MAVRQHRCGSHHSLGFLSCPFCVFMDLLGFLSSIIVNRIDLVNVWEANGGGGVIGSVNVRHSLSDLTVGSQNQISSTSVAEDVVLYIPSALPGSQSPCAFTSQSRSVKQWQG